MAVVLDAAEVNVRQGLLEMAVLPRNLSADGVIDAGPAALLAARGFRRKGRNFHRGRGPFVDSVYFQTFRGSPSSFCVALSLILPYHHFATRGTKLPSSPSSDNASCLATTRIELATDHGSDHWLVVTRERPAEVVAGMVTARLPEALSFFDAFPSVESVIAALRSGSEWCEAEPHQQAVDLAVLLAYAGHSDEALAVLATLPQHAVPRGLTERLDNAAERAPGPADRAT